MDFVVVMGVSGAGKTTVAQAIADATGGVFLEGDAFHPEANIRSMSRGIPLTDDDRWAWLEAICDAALASRGEGRVPVVIACSALKERYRALLRARLGGITLIHLTGKPDLIRQRLALRAGHFMRAAMLESQLADLEPPQADREAFLRIDTDGSKEAAIAAALAYCGARGGMPDSPAARKSAKAGVGS